MRLRRRQPDARELTERKPYLVTIHAAGQQWHTFAMGPGDAVGVAGIRVDIDDKGGIHARPNEVEALPPPSAIPHPTLEHGIGGG